MLSCQCVTPDIGFLDVVEVPERLVVDHSNNFA